MPIQANQLMIEGENLLQICLDVHAATTGSSDPLPQETAQRYDTILRVARDHWTPPHKSSVRFDAAVAQADGQVLSQVTGRDFAL